MAIVALNRRSNLVSRRHSSEYGILWDIFRSQIAKLWFPYDRTIAIDRSWSQTIAEDRTWFYLLRSSAIMIAGSQTIAEWCFHMIADDRRKFCDLRSAIRDRLRSYGNQALIKRHWLSDCGQLQIWQVPVYSELAKRKPENKHFSGISGAR